MAEKSKEFEDLDVSRDRFREAGHIPTPVKDLSQGCTKCSYRASVVVLMMRSPIPTCTGSN